MLNAMKKDLLCVRGNCDTEVDQMVLEFPILADYCFIELDGHTIFATHGHHHNPANPPMLKKGDILLNGHTHIPANQDMADFKSIKCVCARTNKQFILFDTLNTEDEIKWCEYTILWEFEVFEDCGNCIAMEQSDYIIIINR